MSLLSRSFDECWLPFRRLQSACALLFALAITGCAIQEIQLAEAEDMVIAEVVLRAGAPMQLAWLHRTRGSVVNDPLVQDASVVIEAARGGRLELRPAPDELCILEREDTEPETHGSCYASASDVSSLEVVPGETYRLEVRLRDGRTLTAATTVPADFSLLGPGTPVCTVPPLTPFAVHWTPSPTAWVYASEISLRGIRAALAPHNIPVKRDPLRLFGLSLSSRDTAIVLPGEFGVFDRFDEDLRQALTFLQQGLPEGVVADVVVAAADRNYVNWERGGNFNPSGTVRVPSVHGDGTGVFGSMVPKSFQVRVQDPGFPRC